MAFIKSGGIRHSRVEATTRFFADVALLLAQNDKQADSPCGIGYVIITPYRAVGWVRCFEFNRVLLTKKEFKLDLQFKVI